MTRPTPSSRRSTRVLILEGHPLVRAGLRFILENRRGFAVAGDFDDVRELAKRCARNDWDVLLLDLDLGAADGLDLVRDAREAAGKRGLLVLTTWPERAFGARSLQAGADGLLTKSADPKDLIEAIERIATGGRYLSRALTDHLARPRRSASAHDELSAREFQILCGIASGKPGKELAHALGISPKTVCTYRARLLEKLGLKSDADLVQYAIDSGLRRR